MSDLFYIGLCIMSILAVIGIVIGLFLTRYATHVDDDEQHESDANYSEMKDEE